MSTNHRYQRIQKRLAPLRNELLDHPIYGEIDAVERLHVFMQHHVFAVWDFMSLLKTLQQRLCGSHVPWLPPTNRTAARLVNEIVLGEESDEDGKGGFASHFELYHRAMRQAGANTDSIDRFLEALRCDSHVEAALRQCDLTDCSRQFVRRTFALLEGGDICAIASAFTFGREDLLPDVFQRVVDELDVETCGGLQDFKFYLSRHIELDGDEHGPMAAQMVLSLCGNDKEKWRVAEEAADEALRARRDLWDGVYESLRQVRQASMTSP
ncbi:MAG: hypothetical protein CML07_04505 [Psychrobacter sp.]|jgi:hypothetical protein|nr:hypothetical protein [Psychrobacter sp.]